MAGLGSRLGDRLSSIRAEQAGSASVWGGDDPGSAFGAAYVEVAQTAGEALAALADALDTVGANLAAMADTTEASEQANADAFGSLGGQVIEQITGEVDA